MLSDSPFKSLILLSSCWFTGIWVSSFQDASVMSGTPRFSRSNSRSKLSLRLLSISLNFCSATSLVKSSATSKLAFCWVSSCFYSLASRSLLTSSSKSLTYSGFVTMKMVSSRFSLHFLRANLTTSSLQSSSPRKHFRVSTCSESSWSVYYWSCFAKPSISSSKMFLRVRISFN